MGADPDTHTPSNSNLNFELEVDDEIDRRLAAWLLEDDVKMAMEYTAHLSCITASWIAGTDVQILFVAWSIGVSMEYVTDLISRIADVSDIRRQLSFKMPKTPALLAYLFFVNMFCAVYQANVLSDLWDFSRL